MARGSFFGQNPKRALSSPNSAKVQWMGNKQGIESMTKLTTRCRECATVSICVCLTLAASVCGLLWSARVLTAQEAAVSVLLQAQAQENILPPPAVQAPAAERVEAPTPSTYSAQEPREDVEVLMRGPLHEAFANVHQTNPVAGPVMEQRPPEPIEELLPEYKPDGENIKWITGYWSWDDETSQFIWVSGLWREVPPGQRWIPGYWEEANPGFRWVSGFWTAAATEELSYLPAPPESLEQGPSSGAPSDNYFYSPGNWVYQSESYQWQPGYWQPSVENWVWIPARYMWTPGGYVYCAGYWDRLFQDRGVCFAPVRFIQPVYYRPQFYYRPVCRIVTNASIFVHLFVRPSYGHYYFGDWYGDHYGRRGYCSWVNYPSRYRGYDSLYNYYHYGHTPYRNTTFIHWAETQHRHYEDHADYRPRHTYRAENYRDDDHQHDGDREHDRRQVSSDREAPLVEDLDRHVRRVASATSGEGRTASARFHRVDDADQRIARETAVPIRDLQAARHKIETSRRVNTASLNQQSKVDVSNGRVRAARPEIKLALPKSKEIEGGVNHARSRPDKIGSEFAVEKRVASDKPNDSRTPTLNRGPSSDARSARRADGENANRLNEAKGSEKSDKVNPRRQSGATSVNDATPQASPNSSADRKIGGADIKPPKATQAERPTRVRDSSSAEKLPQSKPAERNRIRDSVAPSGSPPAGVPREELKLSPPSDQPKIKLDSGNRNQAAPKQIERSRGLNQDRNQNQANPPQIKSQKQVERSAPRNAPAPAATRFERAPSVLKQGGQNHTQQRARDKQNTVMSQSPPRQAQPQPKIERHQVQSQPKVERRTPEVRQQSFRPSNQESKSNRASSAPSRGSESKRGGDKPKKD